MPDLTRTVARGAFPLPEQPAQSHYIFRNGNWWEVTFIGPKLPSRDEQIAENARLNDLMAIDYLDQEAIVNFKKRD